MKVANREQDMQIDKFLLEYGPGRSLFRLHLPLPCVKTSQRPEQLQQQLAKGKEVSEHVLL